MDTISVQKISDFIVALDRYSIDDRIFTIVNEITHQINHLITYQKKRQTLLQKQELIEILDINTVRELEDQLRDKRRDLIKKIISKKIAEFKDWFEDDDLSLNDFDSVWKDLDISPDRLKKINQQYFTNKATPCIIKDLQKEIAILCELKISEKEAVIFWSKDIYPWLSTSQMHRLNNIINSEEIKQKFIDQVSEITINDVSSKIQETADFSFTNYLAILIESAQTIINPDKVFVDFKNLIESKVNNQLTERDERKQRDQSPKKKEDVPQDKILPPQEKKNQAPAVVSICPCITDFVNTFCSACPSKELVNDSLQRVFRNKWFLYIDDLENRIQQPVSLEMREFLIVWGVVLKEKLQKNGVIQDSIVVSTIKSEEIIEDPLLVRFREIEAEFGKIESRVVEYIQMFITFGYSFEHEKRFTQSLTDLCKSQSQIEWAIQNTLKYISHWRKEEKKPWRHYYTFNITDSYRIFLRQKGCIDYVGSHTEYEKKIKNTY